MLRCDDFVSVAVLVLDYESIWWQVGIEITGNDVYVACGIGFVLGGNAVYAICSLSRMSITCSRHMTVDDVQPFVY